MYIIDCTPLYDRCLQMQEEQIDSSPSTIEEMMKEHDKVEVWNNEHTCNNPCKLSSFVVISSVAAEFWQQRNCTTTVPNRAVILHADWTYVCNHIVVSFDHQLYML